MPTDWQSESPFERMCRVLAVDTGTFLSDFAVYVRQYRVFYSVCPSAHAESRLQVESDGRPNYNLVLIAGDPGGPQVRLFVAGCKHSPARPVPVVVVSSVPVTEEVADFLNEMQVNCVIETDGTAQDLELKIRRTVDFWCLHPRLPSLSTVVRSIAFLSDGQ